MPEEKNWYIYQNKQQLGPYAESYVQELVSNHMIAKDALLFKAGWKDWLPIMECSQELVFLHSINFAELASGNEENKIIPKASLLGRAVLHTRDQLIIVGGVYISFCGIFMEKFDHPLKIGDVLKITCKPDGSSSSFQTHAQVILFSNNPKLGSGYGLRYIDLEPKTLQELQKKLDEQNSLIRNAS